MSLVLSKTKKHRHTQTRTQTHTDTQTHTRTQTLTHEHKQAQADTQPPPPFIALCLPPPRTCRCATSAVGGDHQHLAPRKYVQVICMPSTRARTQTRACVRACAGTRLRVLASSLHHHVFHPSFATDTQLHNYTQTHNYTITHRQTDRQTHTHTHTHTDTDIQTPFCTLEQS